METTLKALIDRFRSKPEWQHPDPAVRAEAVLRLPSSERELLGTIAREDKDARVRRAAIKKIADPASLAALVADTEASVREEAAERLAQLAVHEQAEPASLVDAIAALRDPRHLASVARSAPLAQVREAAIRALSEPRALAGVVRDADDSATRLLALSRIEDAATLLALALKVEQKAIALAAVDRVSEPAALQAIADKARCGAAARRARAKLTPAADPGQPPVVAPLPAFDDEAERRAYEEARAAQEREAAARIEAARQRIELAEAIEGTEGEAIPGLVAKAREERAAFPSARSAEIEALEHRIDAALEAAEKRHTAYLGGIARRADIEALVVEAEGLAEADLGPARTAFPGLQKRWTDLTATADLPDLRARFLAAAAKLQERTSAARAEQSQREQEQVQTLTQLAERAEALVQQGQEAPQREAEQLLREIREALDQKGPAGRRERENALARLEAARKRLYPLVQQLREDADWKRWANVSVQEELCARAEALAEDADVEKAMREARDLDLRWKQAKQAPKEKAEALWTRFRAAREKIRVRSEGFLAQQREQQAENLRKKESLCEQAEALAESSDWLETAEALRKLQAEWKAAGPLPQAVSQRLWERFRKPCDRFFTRWHEHRDQRSEEWAENLRKKEALCERAEALKDSTDWEATAGELKRLQGEWRTIGAVKKNRSEAVWQRFRAACDSFFDRYKNRDTHAREAAAAAREAICAELESLAPADAAGDPPADLVTRVQAAQTAWRQAGSLPSEQMAAFDRRFGEARDLLVTRFAAAFEGTELDPEASRRKAERLVARIEGLLEELAPSEAPKAPTTQDLATRLRDALASNTIGGRAAVEAKWQSAAAEVEAAQLAWKRLGPLVGDEGRALAERFERAGRRFAEERPRVEERPERPRPPRREGPRGRRSPRAER